MPKSSRKWTLCSRKYRSSKAFSIVLEEPAECIDWISQLPEPIIHHILSFISARELKVVSALSKTWYRIVSSFPILDIDDSIIGFGLRSFPLVLPSILEEYPNVNDNYVTKALNRFHRDNIQPICRFRIHLTLLHYRLVPLLDNWIGLAFQHGVKEFDLDTRTGETNAYNLPQSVFASKSVKVVKLVRCCLLHSLNSRDSISDGSSTTAQLQKLCLQWVELDKHILKSLISKFPLIEELSISRCRGVKRIQISHLPKLKILEIECCTSIEMVEVDAPSLQNLSVVACSIHPPKKISMLEFPCLTDLILSGLYMEDIWLQDLVFRLPFLRNLKLINLCHLQRLLISSNSLYRLTVSGCNLVALEIDSPNMLSFRFCGSLNTLISSKYVVGKWEASIDYEWRLPLNINFFTMLRDFISHSNQFIYLDVSAQHQHCEVSFQELKERLVQPVPRIDFLRLHTYLRSSRDYLNLFDCLLWSFHPHILALKIDPKQRANIIQFVCNNIVNWNRCSNEEKKGLWWGLVCFTRRKVRSWLHHLEEVTVVGAEGTEHQLPRTGNISSLKSDSWSEIKFKFRW